MNGDPTPPRGFRIFWIAAAIALFITLLWFAVQAYVAARPTPPEILPDTTGAGTAVPSVPPVHGPLA